MTIDIGELAKAAEASDIGTISGNAYQKILTALEEILKDYGEQYWVPVKIMSKHVGVGDMRVRDVLNKMVEKGIVEVSPKGKRRFYRLIPVAPSP